MYFTIFSVCGEVADLAARYSVGQDRASGVDRVHAMLRIAFSVSGFMRVSFVGFNGDT